MSANDIVFVDINTNEVFFSGCADNPTKGDLVAKFKTLKEAFKKASEFNAEYGIHLIGELEEEEE